MSVHCHRVRAPLSSSSSHATAEGASCKAKAQIQNPGREPESGRRPRHIRKRNAPSALMHMGLCHVRYGLGHTGARYPSLRVKRDGNGQSSCHCQRQGKRRPRVSSWTRIRTRIRTPCTHGPGTGSLAPKTLVRFARGGNHGPTYRRGHTPHDDACPAGPTKPSSRRGFPHTAIRSSSEGATTRTGSATSAVYPPCLFWLVH